MLNGSMLKRKDILGLEEMSREEIETHGSNR